MKLMVVKIEQTLSMSCAPWYFLVSVSFSVIILSYGRFSQHFHHSNCSVHYRNDEGSRKAGKLEMDCCRVNY